MRTRTGEKFRGAPPVESFAIIISARVIPYVERLRYRARDRARRTYARARNNATDRIVSCGKSGGPSVAIIHLPKLERLARTSNLGTNNECINFRSVFIREYSREHSEENK